MGFFDETFVKAKEIVDVACKKTSEVVDVQKLKINATTLEMQVSKYYEQLGKICYQSIKSNNDMPVETETLIEKIENHLIKINEISAEIAESKGSIICQACSSLVSSEDAYCPKCGNKM